MPKNRFSSLNDRLPEQFYFSETRCGYHVSETMKKVWAVELDLLKKFADVCEKHNLNYFMNGGTLLGAVRHGGFIPWDDDADVIMPRKDYNKLWEISAEEFKDPYFFQTSLSEKGFFRTHAQLRNSNTTGFIEADRSKDINKGIFIDIFVLDNIPDDPRKKTRFKQQILHAKKMLIYRYDVDYDTLNLKRKIIYGVMRFFYKVVSFERFFDYFNKKIMGKYSESSTALIGDVTLEWRENVLWDKEWYDGHVYLPFECLMLRAPVNYHEVLKKQYGDYMKLPEDIYAPNGRSHGTVTFDPDKPYKIYFADIPSEEREE